MLNLSHEDADLPRYVLATIYAENISPIRVCAEAAIEYGGVEYAYAPFHLYDYGTHFGVEVPPILHQFIPTLISPRVDLLLIDGIEGIRVLDEHKNLALVIDQGEIQLFKGQ